MNDPLFWAVIVLLVVPAYFLAKTWFQPAGVSATIGATLLVVLILRFGIPTALAAGGYVITTIAEMTGG
ncbi:hypothetical protein HAP47_0022230 [Bradyrhizobium sp. 41S5]|uniref:hypothetical protein n=1 Tax=Bradyrhizobium sp. 41S5 TaxID=1404443 RepID=UPI00156BD71B|nr:hypothetical protein [Bradyrhizobium sp. 41S5]UFX42012.1 hypothetical protein HAP47_0022230 [Bradyrhizobium sp. 41S5]